YITSPAEAVMLAREIRNRHSGIPYSGFLERWVAEAPDDAAEYLKSIAHESPYNHDILSCLRAISKNNDVAAAFDWLNKHFNDSADGLRLQFLSEHASQHPEMFVTKASELPDSFEKSSLFSNLVISFAREDPQFTIDWIQSIEDPMLRIQM